jgi:hypothetical protein|tara:strand:- start:277 stop:1170 length:894 start_codon:yes stop_codon:yes gene_type:complete
MIPTSQIEYYGDTQRWFIGTVIDIIDPLEMGRLKVRIYGIHSSNTTDIPLGDLPWAQVVAPITEGGSSGIGANTGIKPLAQVYGIFLDGKNSQLPLILGSIPKYERVDHSVPESNYVQQQNTSTSSGSMNNKNVLIAKAVDDANLIGKDNKEKAYNFFISDLIAVPFEPHQAAGIVGNMIVESRNGNDIDPIAKNKSEGSFGICQWNPGSGNPSRYAQLVNFANANNLPVESLYCQLQFVMFELYKFGYLGLTDLRASEDVESATAAFERKFERPAEGSSAKRIAEATIIFNHMETV